ncbi:MAG: (2Fe-2S)-binding protein [Chthonomonadaceae bacterium]|nr:(2Fe-2S)-binding protein [Chthonomonadaceae bacterium]
MEATHGGRDCVGDAVHASSRAGLAGENQNPVTDPKPVRACLCFPYSFVAIKERAKAHGWGSVEEITKHLGCGGGCGLCGVYLARMLETGETEFAVVSEAKTTKP